MSYLTITACCATQSQPPIESQHKVQVHSCEEKMALITDVFLVALAATVAIGILLTTNGLVDLGPLNSISILGPEVAYIMLGVAGGVVVINTLILMAKMSSHISHLANINHKLGKSKNEQSRLELENKNKELTTSLSEMEASLTAQTEEHERIKTRLQTTVGECEAEIVQLQKEAVASQTRIIELSTQNEALEKQIAALQIQVDKLGEAHVMALSAKDIEKARQDLLETGKTLQFVHEEISQATQQKAALDQELTANRQALDTLKNQLAEKTESLKTLEATIQTQAELQDKKPPLEPPLDNLLNPATKPAPDGPLGAISPHDPSAADKAGNSESPVWNEDNKKAYEEALTFTTSDGTTYSLNRLKPFTITEKKHTRRNEAIHQVTGKTLRELDVAVKVIREMPELVKSYINDPDQQKTHIDLLQNITLGMKGHLKALETAHQQKTPHIPRVSVLFEKN